MVADCESALVAASLWPRVVLVEESSEHFTEAVQREASWLKNEFDAGRESGKYGKTVRAGHFYAMPS